ncbi:L-gulono-gamma-lactone oxidase [Thecamonas trahens ATCC 50062]|uniref:L-gulono-gamma-lactone oxidase n=1 Tax=Thecamonas trahens ATCC 50062 TaxID=461836 RepID=A0A0L0DMD2_THETB|nr:L-gulono-gamma-lactone oxidase [Thecamonas trahens ATCC 50062]KNC53430.1 L-gulono-gamma-lactone oxidase [Thecamonas trahens ATCC 50062]|eukprot:XP_013754465.1 L-gulono-gamma-lactone oxidase [Thecamonas trahens ATCC 50062]
MSATCGPPAECGEYTSSTEVTNWAESYSSPLAYLFAPRSEDEVVAIVTWAASMAESKPGDGERRKPLVKAFGAIHSPGPLPLPLPKDGEEARVRIGVNMDGIDRVLAYDGEKRVLTVGGGMRLEALNRVAAVLGLALPVLGSISEQSIAGAIATATHGTGAEWGSISAQVRGLRLVDGTGRVVSASATEAPDVLAAGRCHIGALGIVTAVSLELVPAFKLSTQSSLVPAADAFAALDAHRTASDHTKLLWYPHSDLVKIEYTDRVSVAAASAPAASSWFRNVAIGHRAVEFGLWLSSFARPVEAWVETMFVEGVVKPQLAPASAPIVDDSVALFNMDCLFSQYVTEWAVPHAAARGVLEQLRELVRGASFAVHFPIEIRFVARDDESWLSPAYGEGVTYIGIIVYRPYGRDIARSQYWAAYERIMLAAGGRPHWAKAHPLTAATLRAQYPQLNAFEAVRAELDPHGLFTNAALAQVLPSRL